MAEESEQSELNRLSSPPPAGFNAEYAKILLAVREGRKEKPLIDRVTVLVALVTSLVSVLASLGAFVQYNIDRSDRQQKTNFDNQISITKIYFDKMAGENFHKNCEDAKLYARASLVIAGLKEEEVIASLGKAVSTQPVPKPPAPANLGVLSQLTHWAPAPQTPPPPSGVESLARLIYKDIIERTRSECDGDKVPLENPAVAGQPYVAQPQGPGDTTSYALGVQAATNQPPPPGNAYAIYVQYASDGAKSRAEQIGKTLAANANFQIAHIWPVRAVPDHDQIRIFHTADLSTAQTLQRTLGLTDAQIVDLSVAYPNLPARTMEVWLKQ